MFDRLREEIEGLEVPLHRDALIEGFALLDMLDARMAVAVGEFEAAGFHALDGAVSMASWLRTCTRRAHPTAQRIAVHGRKLASLPVLRAAFVAGSLTAGQVEVILAHVRRRHVDRFAEHELELVPLLTELSIAELTLVMEDWRAKADALDDEKPIERDNEVHLSGTIDGRGELRGSVDSDLHALLEAGLRVADSGDRERSLAARRADALATVFQHFLDHQQVALGRRHRPHLNVVMTYEQWAHREFDAARYLDTGQLVSPAQLGVLLCDSTFHRLVTDGASAVLDYGRGTRFWSADLYNAIAVRDQGCRFPGCDRPASWCDVHHVKEWDADDGPTSIDNGVLLCRRHHRMLHSTGFEAKLLPDGLLEVTFPDGRFQTSWPPGTTPPPRPPTPPGAPPPGAPPP